jgi:hypothetical protein
MVVCAHIVVSNWETINQAIFKLRMVEYTVSNDGELVLEDTEDANFEEDLTFD